MIFILQLILWEINFACFRPGNIVYPAWGENLIVGFLFDDRDWIFLVFSTFLEVVWDKELLVCIIVGYFGDVRGKNRAFHDVVLSFYSFLVFFIFDDFDNAKALLIFHKQKQIIIFFYSLEKVRFPLSWY